MRKEQAKPAAAGADSARVFAQVARRSSRIMADFLKRQAETKNSAIADEFGIAKAFMDMSALMFAKPQLLAEARLSVVGYGPNRPVTSNDTPAGRARNRRVTVLILAETPGKVVEIPLGGSAPAQ